MPGPMPYYLEKGPMLSVLEDYFNRDGREGLIRLLLFLRDPANAVVDCGAFDTPALTFHAPGPGGVVVAWNPAKIKQHINEHWFDADGKEWWWNYKPGNAEEIVRQGFIRGIEVALGIDHGVGCDAAELRQIARDDPWAIEMFWKCGQNWFEVWCVWRRIGTTGLVTIMGATPSEDTGNDVVWMTPVAPDDPVSQSAPYALNPTSVGRSGEQGMFVVAQQDNAAVGWASGYPGGPEEASQEGVITPPPAGALYESSGDVVVVVPAEARGGVLPTRRAWTPYP